MIRIAWKKWASSNFVLLLSSLGRYWELGWRLFHVDFVEITHKKNSSLHYLLFGHFRELFLTVLKCSLMCSLMCRCTREGLCLPWWHVMLYVCMLCYPLVHQTSDIRTFCKYLFRYYCYYSVFLTSIVQVRRQHIILVSSNLTCKYMKMHRNTTHAIAISLIPH